jgi:hypothetical protein
MRSLRTFIATSGLLLASGSLSRIAAQGTQDQVTVRTFMLQRLSQQQAADLLAPYMSAGKGEGVFTAGSGVRGVTVRGTRETLVRVDSLLGANDHAARTLRLRFQLIATSDSLLPRDPAIGDVDAALRGMFRFRGYRLLSEGVVFTVEGTPVFSLALKGDEGERYEISGDLRALTTGPGGDLADLSVSLKRPGVEGAFAGASILSTRLNAAVGKTVVLGSGAGQGNTTTMLLVVRPEAQ